MNKRSIGLPLYTSIFALTLIMIMKITLQANVSSTDEDYYFLSAIDSLFFAAMFLFSAIYYLVLYIYSYRESEYLSFSVLCMSSIIITLTSNRGFLFSIIPNLPQRLYNYLDATAIPLTVIMLIYHIYNCYSKYVNIKLAQLSVSLLWLYIIMLMFVPANETHNFMPIYFILLAIAFTLLLSSTIRAKVHLETGSTITLIIISLLIVSIITDAILFLHFNIASTFFIPTMSIYIIVQVDTFIKKSVHAFNNSSSLSQTYSLAIKQLKNEETNFLSSHLKAHFLFNALNIISGYSLFDREKAKGTTSALSIYLKQLFNHDNLNEMSDIENEIELVKAFGYIELERFPGLNIIYRIPEKMPDLPLPSLILQPLLENAINHGVRKKNSRGIGTVVISIYLSSKYMHILIKDDGAGHNIDEFKKAVSINSDGKYHSLYHINYRLKEVYNESLHIYSKEGKGTLVSFKIPL